MCESRVEVKNPPGKGRRKRFDKEQFLDASTSSVSMDLSGDSSGEKGTEVPIGPEDFEHLAGLNRIC